MKLFPNDIIEISKMFHVKHFVWNEKKGAAMNQSEYTEKAQLAADSLRRGEAYEQAGQPERAEAQVLLALKALEQLPDAAVARECSLKLADLCMQQGNMHGADFYYARAMGYDRGLRFGTEACD